MVVIRTYRSKTMSCLTIAVEYRQELENGQIRTTRNLVFVHFILSSHSGVEFFVRREYREFHSGTLSSCLSSVLLFSRGVSVASSIYSMDPHDENFQEGTLTIVLEGPDGWAQLGFGLWEL